MVSAAMVHHGICRQTGLMPVPLGNEHIGDLEVDQALGGLAHQLGDELTTGAGALHEPSQRGGGRI